MGTLVIPLGLVLLCASAFAADSKYRIPDLKYEALKSGGFRVYMPDVPGMSLVGFHANVNEDISSHAVGSIVDEVRSPTDGYWVLTFDKQLRVGDTVNYWLFVNYNRLGYRKDGVSFKVAELKDQYTPLSTRCITGTTVRDGGLPTCVGDLLIDDQFNGPSISTNHWIVQHMIPTYSPPNYEFNSYENRDDTRFIKNNKLHLKPIWLRSESDVRGKLDLRQGCTSSDDNQCYYEQASSFLLPPVKSAKIKSKVSFRYGRIEIKAKLPAGDWIFPVIQLEPKEQTDVDHSCAVWIAYSRGNDHLLSSGNTQLDIRAVGGANDYGSRLLFAGPVVQFEEPERSRHLVSRWRDKPFCNEFHVYSLNWQPGQMQFFIDGDHVGTVPYVTLGDGGDRFRNEFVLSLGVAVGGINDFPDGFHSGNNPKPWMNGERDYIKNFFKARSVWSKTWVDDNTDLVVESVKVWAV